MKKETQKSQIIIYKAKNGQTKIDVRFDGETVWLTQKLLAELFGVTIPTINEHIKNVYKEGELKENSTIRKFLIVQKEGNREVERPIDFYNLDIIISVGYRVKSSIATAFRQWATLRLREYIVKGYAVNEKRILEAREKFRELQTAVSFLEEKSKKELLIGQEKEIINLLSSYAKTLTILDEYDKGKIKDIKGRKSKFVLTYENCARIIAELKGELILKKEAGDLFGHERSENFKGIIKGLYQTFGGKELYPNIEDKASHILYLIIKDHPFSDGNKRSAAFLFVYFLDKSDYLYNKSGAKKISDNTLTALALLVAESNPKEKDTMIKIIKNILNE